MYIGTYLFFLQVLDAGRIHEYDAPHVLLQNQNGILYKMVQQTGKAEAASLLQTAKEVSRSSLCPQERGDPLHQFNTDVNSHIHVALSDGQICATCTCARNPQYAVFQRAQAFVLSVSISFPLLSGMLFSLRIRFLSTSFNR